MQTESGLAFLSRIGARPICEFGKDLFEVPLSPPEVIEVSGIAGVGKSLLCLDFMATTLLPKTLFSIPLGGMEAGVIFIDCDQHFNILHFTDLMERKIKRVCYNARSEWKKQGIEKTEQELLTIHKKDFNKKIDNAIAECLKNLTYFNCTNSHQFAVNILSLEHCIMTKPNVSLIMIDSISSFYWYDRIYKVDAWYKMEIYLNNIFHKFLDIIKKNYLVCVCTKQNLFKKRINSKDGNRNTNPIENLATDEPVIYDFLGKEWTKGVSLKINMIPHTKRGGQTSSGSEDNDYCIVEAIQGTFSKITHCTFHEDGIRIMK